MSLTIPQDPRELESFLVNLFNDITIEPQRLRKALAILRKMAQTNKEKQALLNKFPVFDICPDALSQDKLNTLLSLTGSTPQAMWYGRLRLYTYKFETVVSGKETRPYHVTANNVTNTLDTIVSLFFDSLRSMNEMKEGRWKFYSVIDRNVVTKENASTSGLSWHRDRFEDIGPEHAHYTLFILLSDHTLWKSGEIGMQLGGEKKDDKWINSTNPQIHLVPRYNQAITVKNIDSAYKVEPLIIDQEVKRDVFILTANFVR